MNQENLFDRIEQVRVTYLRDVNGRILAGKSIADRFQLFTICNPHIYAMIRKIALDLKLTGHRRMGMKAIFERLRWLYAIQTKGDVFKLNNSFTSHYSRLLMEQEPELAGFFELRGKE
jgi:hypothetical protein